jgi:pimeloyl-ACP methyl ester carboxylesterase
MKPAVVLLHSSMSSKAQWGALAEQLSDRFDCVALDLQGYGTAPFPSGAAGATDTGYVHTLAHEAAAVDAALVARLAPGQPFHLVGHSFGGAVALHMARQAPRRLLSLALFEPVAFHLLPVEHPAHVEISGVVARINACAEDRDATRIFIDYWNRAGAFDAAPASAQDKMIAQIAKVRLDFEALLGEAATLAELSPVTMPALVMAGERSPASTRLLAEQLAAALPNATGLRASGGHMGPITHGEAVNPHIVAFLGRAATAAD